MQPGEEMNWVPQLLVLKNGQVIDNVLLHGKETFILGRYQNCDIVAGHASISRHHLEIRVLHESRELLLMDLRSLHGTKINEKPVLPMEAVAMKEDEKFQLGASSRSYIVKWIPVTRDISASSSSSFTPSKSSSSIVKGLQEEFQSALRLTDLSEPPTKGSKQKTNNHFHDQENANCENEPPAKATNMESIKRMAFAEVNGRCSTSKHSYRKPKSPALKPPSPSPRKAALRVSPAGKKLFGERQVIQDQSPSKLWLRRCTSTPLPSLNTNLDSSFVKKDTKPAESPHLPSAPPLVAYEDSPDDSLNKTSKVEEYYYSDKENVAPPVLTKADKASSASKRQPFKQLFFLPSPGADSEYKPVFAPAPCPSSDEDSLDLPKHRRGFSSVPSAENILRRQKTSDSADLKKHWHIVVDTNCFLDESAFKVLKQLEGIRETRVIIPRIVVRELDFLKNKNGKKGQARKALRWIEECMMKMSWWIHVQNSNETRPVCTTPPVSPSPTLNGDFFQSAMDLLSPTNDDHVLDCALLFQRSVLDGRVVLLTSDTALKIKAMAEGLVSEDSKTFCNSLLSPYSERFLWAGSTGYVRRNTAAFSPLGRSSSSNTNSSSSSSRCYTGLVYTKHQPLDDLTRGGLQVVL